MAKKQHGPLRGGSGPGHVRFADGGNGEALPHTQAVRQAKRRQSGSAAAQLVADVRFRRRMERFWPLGSRVAAELLAQLAAEHDCQAQIERFLDRAVENEQAIREFGFDQWPELPMRVVR